MRKLTFKCVITSGMTPFIDLQQKPVALQQNGNTWSGSLPVDVDDTLNLAVSVNGINGSSWTVDITIDCPGGSPAKIFSRNGTIPHGGTEAFKTSAKVTADPCGQKMEMVIAKTGGAPKRKARTKRPKVGRKTRRK